MTSNTPRIPWKLAYHLWLASGGRKADFGLTVIRLALRD